MLGYKHGYNLKLNNLMRQLFTLITLSVAVLFAACDAENEGGALKHFAITSEATITVEAEGGNVAVTFTLKENGDGSVTLSYTTGAATASVVPTLTLKAPTLEFKDTVTVKVNELKVTGKESACHTTVDVAAVKYL